MFSELRRKDRRLDNELAMELLRTSEYGVLSSIGENGYPYGVPLNHVLMGENIYFHCAKKGLKLDNIKSNDKVSYCVIGPTQLQPQEFATNYTSAIVFGNIIEVEDGVEKDRVLEEFINKFSLDYLEEGKAYIGRMKENTKVLKVVIEHITGKARK